jgi:hypothetical protein
MGVFAVSSELHFDRLYPSCSLAKNAHGLSAERSSITWGITESGYPKVNEWLATSKLDSKGISFPVDPSVKPLKHS